MQDSQDFVSLSEQDQAILRYRKEAMASVVRDRLIANGSRSGDLDLQNENPENLVNPAFNLTKIKK